MKNIINIRLIILFSCCLLFGINQLSAKIDTLSYIGEKVKNGSTHSIDILKKLHWDGTIITTDGKSHPFTDKWPDSLLKTNTIESVHLSASFIVSSKLLNRIFALHNQLDGSVLVKLNSDTIVATGHYQPYKTSELSHLIVDRYENFVFIDSVEKIDVNYSSRKQTKVFDLELEFYQSHDAEINIHNAIRNDKESNQMGFYYLALGIVFLLLFLFSREQTENIYFSFFCILASFRFLWDNFHSDVQHIYGFITILWLEFLSMFFKKVLKEKEKSKIPLVIIICTFLICLLPPVRYYYTTFFGFGSPFPVLVFIPIISLVIYSGFSCLYFLVQGLRQKKWESKVIIITCFIPIALIIIFYLFIIILSVIPSSKPEHHADFVEISFHYLFMLLIYTYPLGAVYILGRRNGLNQKTLLNQLKSIKQLSDENLAKEQEKQQLLASQNEELEKKVASRTSEVMQQKEIIEIKNKAITDNLNYAQRIQSAILPDIKLIYKALQNSFILYLPKDIVSGDFYAFAEQDNKVLVIAGDCTGHGVSGAFMSMIGSSLLNQIINQQGLAEPALILNQLNSAVIDTFRQSVHETNDGMDVSICAIDLNANTLKYAGANRPLWLIRNNEIIIIKPDKYPIGGLQMAKDRLFTSNFENLQKNDSIYIFTDGYADQFGGERGKKMMTAKFKEILLSLNEMPMKQQENYLKDYFEKWQGENEQVDDVLVIGVRI